MRSEYVLIELSATASLDAKVRETVEALPGSLGE